VSVREFYSEIAFEQGVLEYESNFVNIHSSYSAHKIIILVMFLGFFFLNCNIITYEGWNVNSGNYLFTTDTK